MEVWGIALQLKPAPAVVFGALRHFKVGSNPCRVLISFNWGQLSGCRLAALLLLLRGLNLPAVQAGADCFAIQR